MVRAKTLDMMVPANAEIILEGRVPAGERRREGPFGDHFGHYSEAFAVLVGMAFFAALLMFLVKPLYRNRLLAAAVPESGDVNPSPASSGLLPEGAAKPA